MYYEVYISAEGDELESFIRHLYNNGYNFYETKYNDEIILVFEDEINYIQTIADDNGIEINICGI